MSSNTTSPSPRLGRGDSAVNEKDILDQLQRILVHPLFSKSTRYPALLRYVVEHRLQGDFELKERFLGVAVFGRDATYDNNLDPVVRNTAYEIRKRLTQYYSERGHKNELRIDLPAGYYVPEFRWPEPDQSTDLTAPEEPVSADAPQPFLRRLKLHISPATVVICVGLFGFLAVGFFLAGKRAAASPAEPPGFHGSVLEEFWAPVLQAPDPVVLSVGARPGEGTNLTGGGAAPDLKDFEVLRNIHGRLDFDDVQTLGKIVWIFGAAGKTYEVHSGPATTFSELRHAPAVLIGSFNNLWTMQLLRSARYTFEDGPSPRIKDTQDESKSFVAPPLPAYYRSAPELDDYALISRVHDSNTEGVVVIAGGIHRWGTLVAGEFLSDSKYMHAALANAPEGWRNMNMQIVLQTKVINDSSGPPRVVASYFW